MSTPIGFFVGSGISLATIPNSGVKTITDKLVDTSQYTVGSDKFYYSKYLESLYLRYTEYLEKKLGSGFKASYEDLYSILDQIIKEENTLTFNYVLKGFVENEKRSIYSLFSGSFIPIDIRILAYRMQEFIENTIRDHLINSNSILGFNLFDDLIKENLDLNIYIFSLNHDLLIEKYLDGIGISFADGFHDFLPESRIHCFDDWNHKKVKLFKLHGGINWKLLEYSENGKTNQTYGIQQRPTVNDANKRSEIITEKGSYLTGISKDINYHDQIFGEMQYQFSQFLHSGKRLIMSGYGWNDRVINRKLNDWLLRDHDAKILLLHENSIDDLFANSRYFVLYKDHVDSGQIVHIRKWFSNTTFHDIQGYL